ncbi:MAG TPA: diguanylate cyclase [Candidatus Hydrogenedentes bacterium]|nr:diguanylate cyclase [Candidatus Hydrogenedentota bacterium]
MPKLLIVEDSKVMASLLRSRIRTTLGYELEVAANFAELTERLRQPEYDFMAALLDLGLPDAAPEQIIDLVIKKRIPAIVFSAEFDPRIQDMAWSKHVVDYVTKEGPQSIEYLLDLLKRIEKNKDLGVLIVDDSVTMRRMMGNLLRVHRYQVFEASQGAEALDILENRPEIVLVITDFNMPVMDGFELTKAIRGLHGKRDVSIIGMSSQQDKKLSTRFIKNGADDFLITPFSIDEFYCRVRHNVEMIEHVRELREASFLDFLTGLRNRRYLFEAGRGMLATAHRDHSEVALAMIDVDFFKKVNDQYGHEAGDLVLQHIGRMLKKRFRQSGIAARLGGEEFCVLAIGMDSQKAYAVFDAFRAQIAASPIQWEDATIAVSVSIGITTQMEDTLDEMLSEADTRLYEAKRGGRNRVVG